MNDASHRYLWMGNEAIARGLIESGCALAASYPGTPASEILAATAAFKQQYGIRMHCQWAVNEKIAFEIAYAGSMTGLRTAVSMKQVGLNVASDPLMSAAYMGAAGGFVIISADDPGPHSSQTEQDSRLMAMMAKIPVLDPDSPRQAKDMVTAAYRLSEEYNIPVMLRPTTRVCHARQDVIPGSIAAIEKAVDFKKEPSRWAATPKFRSQLHLELEEKLGAVARHPETQPLCHNPHARSTRAIVAAGVAAAHIKDILRDMNLCNELPFYQVVQPFPLHADFCIHLLQSYTKILVVEETTAVIEMQLADRERVSGKRDGTVPKVGELLPEHIQDIVGEFAGRPSRTAALPSLPGRRPTLCAGCPHRASFFAIKKAAPKAIYTSDIGCYTLGLNLKAVDTVLCMGAAVSQAAGFYQAFKYSGNIRDIVATIGDSTFFHSGVPALIDAVNQNVRFVLVILDNRTTAMTGSQPTPATGKNADGQPLTPVEIEALVRGCGVGFCEVGDPYDIEAFTGLVKQALQYGRSRGPAVVVARHPCIIDQRRSAAPMERITVEVSEDCDDCGYCLQHFECPALVRSEELEQMRIDPIVCSGCGVCLNICPRDAVVQVKQDADGHR